MEYIDDFPTGNIRVCCWCHNITRDFRTFKPPCAGCKSRVDCLESGRECLCKRYVCKNHYGIISVYTRQLEEISHGMQ